VYIIVKRRTNEESIINKQARESQDRQNKARKKRNKQTSSISRGTLKKTLALTENKTDHERKK